MSTAETRSGALAGAALTKPRSERIFDPGTGSRQPLGRAPFPNEDLRRLLEHEGALRRFLGLEAAGVAADIEAAA